MAELSKEDIIEIKDHFQFFDKDGSGTIDLDEFRQLLRILAPASTNDNAERGFETIDTDKNALIDFEEFLDWWKMNWTVF